MKTDKLLMWFSVVCLLAAPAAAQNSKQNYLSNEDLLKLAGDKYASGELPLGDSHYVLDAPRKGYIYLCHKFGEEGRGGAGRDGDWIHGQTWNLREKLAVQGQVQWNEARFSSVRDGPMRILTGNGLPINHPTGIFPIQSNDPAYFFDRNPNSIQPQSVHETLPVDPAYSDLPFCMGMEVGYMLNGVPLFDGFDAGLRDAAAHEVQDSCQGHPQRSGTYHYHSLSSCVENASVRAVIGYALDGFPITGPMVEAGKYLTTDDLDECHGITSEIIEDGQKKTMYHYVMTVDFPYSVSCFRAHPVRTGPSRQQTGVRYLQGNGSEQPQSPNSNSASTLPQPPPEALGACSGKSDGDQCGFISPRGDEIAGTCHAPPQSSLTCIPARRP